MSRQANQGNGPSKDQLNDHEDFSSWRNQSIQNSYVSGVAPSNSADPYLSSYYGGAGAALGSYQHSGPWTSSHQEMPPAAPGFLGYGGVQHQQQHHDSYGIDGMFSGPAPAAGFGVLHHHQQQGNYGGYEYSTWESRKQQQNLPVPHYEDYYHPPVYQAPRLEENVPSIAPSSNPIMQNAPPVKQQQQVEQGMQGLSLAHHHQQQHRPNNKSTPPPESNGSGGGSNQQAKKLTWASIASQPAKPQPSGGGKKKSMVPPPMVTPRTPSTAPPSVPPAPVAVAPPAPVPTPPMSSQQQQQLDIGTWAHAGGGGEQQVNRNGPPVQQAVAPPPPVQQAPMRPTSAGPPPPVVQQQRPAPGGYASAAAAPPAVAKPAPPPAALTPPKAAPAPSSTSSVSPVSSAGNTVASPILEELQSKHVYNPKDFDPTGNLARNARFFVIKSYSEDDIHRSIKYEIWCSTEHGNKRLDAAFREREGKGPIYLYFSVNGSGHFCGMAEMTSAVDMSSSLSVWSQDKWRGQFTVKWIYVKDVPNAALRHIRLENNENKPVTNSRDTQEVLPDKGRMVLKILQSYRHATSIFDDFSHYEKRQAEEDQKKTTAPAPSSGGRSKRDPEEEHHQQQGGGREQHQRSAPPHRGGGRGGEGDYGSRQPPARGDYNERDRERDRERDHQRPTRNNGADRGGYGGGSNHHDYNNHRDRGDREGGYRGGGGPRDHREHREHRDQRDQREQRPSGGGGGDYGGRPNNANIDRERDRDRGNMRRN